MCGGIVVFVCLPRKLLLLKLFLVGHLSFLDIPQKVHFFFLIILTVYGNMHKLYDIFNGIALQHSKKYVFFLVSLAPRPFS